MFLKKLATKEDIQLILQGKLDKVARADLMQLYLHFMSELKARDVDIENLHVESQGHVEHVRLLEEQLQKTHSEVVAQNQLLAEQQTKVIAEIVAAEKDLVIVRDAWESAVSGLADVAYLTKHMIEVLNEIQRRTGEINAQSLQGIQAMNGTMNEIRKIQKKWQEVSGRAPQLMDIISQLDEMTQRIRMCSFNLGIEAAHLGLEGKGVSVVSEEIQKLNDGNMSVLKPQTKLVQEIIKEIKESDMAFVTVVTALNKNVTDFTTLAESLDYFNTSTASLIDSIGAITAQINNVLTVAQSKQEQLNGVIAKLQATREFIVSSCAKSQVQIDMSKLTDLRQQVAAKPKVVAASIDMKDRISFIEHKGAKILYYDFSYFTKEQESEFVKTVNYAKEQYAKRGIKDILVITNLQDTYDSPALVKAFDEFRDVGQNYLLASAVIGASTRQKVLIATLGKASKVLLKACANLEEAREYLYNVAKKKGLIK